MGATGARRPNNRWNVIRKKMRVRYETVRVAGVTETENVASDDCRVSTFNGLHGAFKSLGTDSTIYSYSCNE